MRYKKHYNNLFDSIVVTFLLLVGIIFYSFVIWYGVLFPKDGTDPHFTFIVSTIFFGIINITCIIIIFFCCYEYWILSDCAISSKKNFRRKVIINLNEIEAVEKKVISAFVMGLYKSEAYIICSRNKKIVILINEVKRFTELEDYLAPYINK